MEMKRICMHAAGVLLFMLLLGGTVSAAEAGAWGSIQGETAILCLPGAEGDDFTCQVGGAAAEIASAVSLSDLETPVETVILIDNSLSIQKDQRPVIKEFLGDLIANRLAGERYTIATISDEVTSLCSGESVYSTLKALIDNLEFKDQRTQLTDGLYHVLEGLKQSDEGTLRRLVIIADGVDNKQVGYTQSELAALIQETGYPVYTVGCANHSSSATEELQNLFALSRLTSGASYYLPEVQDTMSIVSGVTAWNDSVRLEIKLPREVCDGMPKVLRVTSGAGADVYLTELKMPLAELQEPEETLPEPAPSIPAPEPEPQPEAEKQFPWGILLAAVLAVFAGIAAAVLLRKRKNKERIEEAPDVKPPIKAPAVTEMLSASNDNLNLTDSIWSASPSVRLILQDLSQPDQRIEAVLHGEVLVGRDASACQVVLAEPSVARTQCRIYQQGSWIMVSNLSQSNITKLNGQAVMEDCELPSGSTLQMGRLHMRVELL